MSTDTRDFHLGDVLSVAHGWLVSPNHIGGVYEVLDFMEGWPHMTHQLPSACDRVRPDVLAQWPALADADAADPGDFFDGLAAGDNAEGAKERAEEWCRIVADRLGVPLTLTLRRTALSPPEDPIESLCDMVGPEKVFVFGPDAVGASGETEQ